MDNTRRSKIIPEICYEGQYFNVVRDPNGSEYVDLQLSIGSEGKAAVVVVPVFPNHQNPDDPFIILVSQFRKPHGVETWELPGGTVRKDELPLEAACRELAEEVGLDVVKPVTDVIYLGQLTPSPGWNNELVHCYAIEFDTEDLTRNTYGELPYEFFAVSEIACVTTDDESIVFDARTLAAIFRYVNLPY